MGNSQSPPADPHFTTASRAFSKQELDELKSLFISLASQSQTDSKSISLSVFQAYFGIKGVLGSRMFDLLTRGQKDGMLTFEDLVIAKAIYEKGTRDEIEGFIYQLCDVGGDGNLDSVENELNTHHDVLVIVDNTCMEVVKKCVKVKLRRSKEIGSC